VNRRTWRFKSLFDALPAEIREAATAAFEMFLANPQHPALRIHELKPTKKGQHLPGSISVSVTISYRAIYVVNNGVNVWSWIGTHADYNRLIGRK
jgi:hypothetical protein